MNFLLAAAVIAMTTAAAHAGKTYVRDADTIVVDGTPVRLNGVDAPELSTQSAQNAKRRTINYLRGKTVSCDLNGERTHDR